MASGRIEVTSAQLEAAIQTLTEKNSLFNTKVQELVTLQEELRSQWEGEANNAFNAAFETDKGKWGTFSQTIEHYIQALRDIKQTYDQVEATNTATATNRTF